MSSFIKILNELQDIPITVKSYDYNRPEPESKKSSRKEVDDYNKILDKNKPIQKNTTGLNNIQKAIQTLSDKSIQDLEKYIKVLQHRDKYEN